MDNLENNNQNNYNTDWAHLNKSVEDLGVHGEVLNSASLDQTHLSEEESSLKRKSIFFKIFIGGIVAVLLALLYVGVEYYMGKNTISQDKIVLNLNIDDNVKGGQSGVMNFSILNNNSLPLLDARVTIKIQKGFSKDGVVDQDVKVFDFGNIDSKVYAATTTDYIFNGEEGDKRKVLATFDYAVAGSNSIFKKDISKEVKIISPSFVVSLDGYNDVIENYDYALKAKVKNISYTGNGNESLVLKVNVPPGFIVNRTTSTDPTTFQIGNMAQGEEKEFWVSGYFVNVLSNSKTFSANLSTSLDNTSKSLITSASKEVNSITSPLSFTSSVKVDSGESKYFVTNRYNVLNLKIKNNSDDYISDMVVLASTTGASIRSSKNDNQNLEKLNPGDEVDVDLALGSNILGSSKTFNIEVFGVRRGYNAGVLLKRFVVTYPVKAESY